MEVTSLIQERDAAVEEARRRGQALADAMRQNEIAARERNDAQRQRDDAVRQRDETARKFETSSAPPRNSARSIGETQKQLLTIRQARDGAHAQILELTNKLAQAEDQVAEAEYQRELAQKAPKQAAPRLRSSAGNSTS